MKNAVFGFFLGLMVSGFAATPLKVFIDGEQVGTLAAPGLVYDLDAGEIHITSHELVFGCQQDRYWWDRFEER